MIAMRRGFRHRCPNCGKGALYSSYLKLTEQCSECREALGHIRADDIPAYFTILIVGHVIVPSFWWRLRWVFRTGFRCPSACR